MLPLPLAHYRFHCRALTPLSFPRYAGSTWRGAFGHALKKSVCVTRQPDCRDCLLWRSCAYSYIFETPPPENADILRKYPAAPHPFIIHPEATNSGRYQAGEPFSVDLTLIGHANARLPYLVHAWQKIGDLGIGGGKGRFELESVEQQATPNAEWQEIHRRGNPLTALSPQTPPPTPAPNGQCVLTFHTPLRVRYRDRLMGVENFSFRGLLAALLRRLSLLCYFHGDTPLEIDFRTLIDQAKSVTPLRTELRWFDWKRYSNRQKTEMHMGGLLGQVILEGQALAPFWPWLSAGQWLHVGKGTVMGLGKYQVEPLSEHKYSRNPLVETDIGC
ncbi:CRISPR system precrRNA processing endoribonuclease RAMP protein Cas6 [Methylohalobius crimeensis]|uniref:CRISPR system precrRNA processing endoribonuclease RAMP protein Cas6 n=1 Tax=Methylohalobius crimeensis TaxID=244365 RepID=UPI0003B4781C|nr:CRISPR system precrRNA processing endoribonuclease RAMP protein Cas6 [Methylohalobius crimeensis]